jgi:hypothetical protein
MNAPRRPWHGWYDKFAPTSDEVKSLWELEPADLPDWAVGLRQEFPTIPPDGVEMCHARWLETLSNLVDGVADGEVKRRSHSCGDIPPETVAGLGLRRRILIAWLNGRARDDMMAEFAGSMGNAPDIADLLFDVLGEVSRAGTEVRQDIEFLADLFSGPYEAGNAPLYAKWRSRVGELDGRKSVLSALKERAFPVVTNLCNYRTLDDVDRLIGMVARQRLDIDLLGPCNVSLKFILQDQPERLAASIAYVWALHRFAAAEFRARIEPTPTGVRDQCNAIIKRIGHSDPTKAWLAASLGFLIKKWVRRAWHIMQLQIPNNALPDFAFESGDNDTEELMVSYATLPRSAIGGGGLDLGGGLSGGGGGKGPGGITAGGGTGRPPISGTLPQAGKRKGRSAPQLPPDGDAPGSARPKSRAPALPPADDAAAETDALLSQSGSEPGGGTGDAAAVVVQPDDPPPSPPAQVAPGNGGEGVGTSRLSGGVRVSGVNRIKNQRADQELDEEDAPDTRDFNLADFDDESGNQGDEAGPDEDTRANKPADNTPDDKPD